MGLTENLQRLTGEWSTDVLPTATTLTHINPTNIKGVVETLLSASSAYPEITKAIDLYLLARAVKGAKASLLVISAQNYIATATATQDLPMMTLVIWNSTMELQDLEMGFNLYQMKLSRWANLTFAVIFAFLVIIHTGISSWRRTTYFGVCLVAGTFLETVGYAARVLSIGNYSDQSTFICQIISLTLAPAFIMAGVYYLLAQLMVIHGPKYSMLRPLWYSYIFIVCDVCSLFIQAAGGGLAAIRLQVLESTHPGTVIMTVGVAFQVFSMTLFLFFFMNFLWRIYFRASPSVKFLLSNFGALFFQTNRGRELQRNHLNPMYNQEFRLTIERTSFGYYPLALFLACFFIYVRCVYRLVELSEGWSGYLITHEEFVMTLDGLQVLITCIILVLFHPGLIFGKGFKCSLKGKPTETDYINENSSYSSDEKNESIFYSNDEKLSKCSLDWSSYNMERSTRQTVAGQQSEQTGTFNVIPYFKTPKQSPFNDSSATIDLIDRDNGFNVCSASELSNEFQMSKQNQAQNEKPKKNKIPKIPVVFPGAVTYSLDPVIEDEIVAVPYQYCHETPLTAPQTPQNRPRRHSRSSRKSDTASIFSVNPYERECVDVIKTSGPYELYERPELASEYQLDHGDVESNITNDEFLFTFGSKNQKH